MDMPSLTLRHKIAQLVFPRIGSNLPPVVSVTEDADRLKLLLKQVPIGGLCLFNGAWPATPKTLLDLQSMLQIPLLVAADLERGAGQQIKGMTVFPHAMALGRSDLAAEYVAGCASITAQQARAAGIQMVLGPVADVNSDPRNPIIATRAFSTDTDEASRLVAAAVDGLHAGGVLAVAKHFPGHGNTHEDSHDSLPQVIGDRSLLLERDVRPFRAAIRAGVRAIMTAHVAYPAFDPSGAPATVSRPILTDLLRGELGFDGVIMTDSLLMAGIRDRFSDEVAMSLAVLKAGGDVLLDIADPVLVVDGLLQAVDQGTLSTTQIDAAFERVWRLKAFLLETLGESAFCDKDQVFTPSFPAAEEAARQVATSAIKEFGTESCRAAPPVNGQLGMLVVKPFNARWDPVEQPIVVAVRASHPDLIAWELSPESDNLEKVFAEASACGHLIVAMIVKPAAWHRFGLLAEQTDIVRRLGDSVPMTLVSLGVPTALDEFTNIPRRLCTFSDVEVSQQAVAEYLTRNSFPPSKR